MLDYLIPLMALFGCGLSVVMTIQAASGFIFSGKDSDLMLSSPVSAFSVMLSRYHRPLHRKPALYRRFHGDVWGCGHPPGRGAGRSGLWRRSLSAPCC